MADQIWAVAYCLANRSCPVNAVNNDPGVGHLPIQRDLHVGHLNSFLELGEGNLTAKNWKFQMLGVCPGGDIDVTNWLVHKNAQIFLEDLTL